MIASHVRHTLFKTSAAKQKKLLETRGIFHRRVSDHFPPTEAARVYEQRV